MPHDFQPLTARSRPPVPAESPSKAKMASKSQELLSELLHMLAANQRQLSENQQILSSLQQTIAANHRASRKAAEMPKNPRGLQTSPPSRAFAVPEYDEDGLTEGDLEELLTLVTISAVLVVTIPMRVRVLTPTLPEDRRSAGMRRRTPKRTR